MVDTPPRSSYSNIWNRSRQERLARYEATSFQVELQFRGKISLDRISRDIDWSIINSYWTRLSKISWFVCGEQINYLPNPKAETNNSSARHWQITIFCSTGFNLSRVLSFDHRVCFFNEYSWEAKRSQERSQEGEKHGFLYAWAEYFAAKHCWTALRMSRPLFVGSYLQVTWWVLGQWKERKICFEW